VLSLGPRYKPKDISIFTFKTMYVHYKFTVMLFDRTNASIALMNSMNKSFAPYLGKLWWCLYMIV